MTDKMANLTDQQLKFWAGLKDQAEIIAAWEGDNGWFLETVPALAAEVLRLRAEHAFMKEQIQKLDRIMTDSIKEKDGPDRLNIDGIWYEGPVVDGYFKMLSVMQKAYRLILERV